MSNFARLQELGLFPPPEQCLICRTPSTILFARRTTGEIEFGLCARHGLRAVEYAGADLWMPKPITQRDLAD